MHRLRLGFFLASLVLLLTACPAPGTKVDAPTNVQATGGVNKIIVSWDFTGEADGFNIYRSEDSGDLIQQNSSLVPSDTTQYEDTSVSKGVAYRYAVTAVKGIVESAKSPKTPVAKSTDEDTQNPTVTLTSNPELLTASGPVTLTAAVTDDGTISKVEFFRGAETTPFATDTDGSDDYKASVTVNETTTFKAVATDSTGKTGQDDVTVTVDGGTTSCQAEAKTFTGVVNTPLKGGTRAAGEIAAIVAPLIAASCADDAAKVSDPAHGDVAVNADGALTYTPDFKYVGADSFEYSAGGKTATVNITIDEVSDVEAGDQYIYYVDNASSGPATGSFADPFMDIANVEAASDPGDIIYILSGDAVYQGTVDMKKNQKLLGQGTDFVVNGLTLAEAGTAPRITASGSEGNEYGIKLGKGILPSYAVVGTLEIKGITIQDVQGGPAEHFGSGIYSDNLQGKVIIEDVTIRNTTGHGMYLDHNNHDKPIENDIAIRNVNIQNPGQFGIWVDDATNLLIEGGSITGVTKTVAYSGVAIDPQDEFGNYGAGKSITIRNVTIQSSSAGVIGIRLWKNNKWRNFVNASFPDESPVAENTNAVIEGNTITLTGGATTGILVQPYFGTECKAEGGFAFTGSKITSILNYEEDQGHILLSGSTNNIITALNKYERSGVVASFPGICPDASSVPDANKTTYGSGSFGNKIEGTIPVQ
jgi:Bacterial Ig domain/Right handed beta helix region